MAAGHRSSVTQCWHTSRGRLRTRVEGTAAEVGRVCLHGVPSPSSHNLSWTHSRWVQLALILYEEVLCVLASGGG